MSPEPWTIFLDDFLAPGLNGPRGLERRHWGRKKADKKKARERIQLAHASQHGGPLPVFTGEVDVTYMRVRKKGPPMDEDNLKASFKDIGDALEALGVVENDRLIRLTAQQTRHPKSGTFITLEARLALV